MFNGGHIIRVHSLVLFARCREIIDEIFEVDGTKCHERWSHLSMSVVSSFISYLYCGSIEIQLETHEDIETAKYFVKNYPNLNSWKTFINFIIDNDDDQTN